MMGLYGWIMWRIGLYGVATGRIGRSRFFNYALSRGGAWAFGREA